MKKDNTPILKKSLSTLLKRFSSTDIVGTLEKDYSESIAGQVKLSLIKDNHVLKSAKLSDSELRDTMDIILSKGITSPLFVIANEDGYEIVLSRLVFLAAKKLNLETVPIAILNIDEEEMLVMLALYLRDLKNASIIELSLILNRMQKKYHYTQSDIATIMKQSRSQITNVMRLKKMPSNILADISNGKLSFGHARAISTLSVEQMNEIVTKIYDENLSVRAVEKIVSQIKGKDNYINDEEYLNHKYKCQSSIYQKRVVLTFDNETNTQEFLKKIKSV